MEINFSRMLPDLGKLTILSQQVKYILLLCGDLFGIWLELGVPLGVFFLTGSLLPLPTSSLPPLIGATPDITTMSSQNQAGQTISDD